MKRFLLGTALLLAASRVIFAQIEILRSDEKGMIIEFSAGDLKAIPVVIQNRTYHYIALDGCPNTIDCGKPSLPQYSFMAAIPYNADAVISRIELLDREQFSVIPLPNPYPEAAEENSPIDSAIYLGPSRYPSTTVSISRSEWARNNKVITVTFYPVGYEPSKSQLIYNRKIRVAIEYKNSSPLARPSLPAESSLDKVLQKVVINPKQAETWACRSLTKSGEISCDTMPYKILIRDEGIYKVSYNDFISAGISPNSVDPRTIKIINKGQEIPIYFKGQSDGIFDYEDYFEFYGKAVRGDSSYFHQFSNSNVYYMSLTGSLGARMVEENGTPILPGIATVPFATKVLHFEKDSLFYRLSGWSSSQNDRWFWKRLDYPESAVIPLNIPSPAGTINDSFTIRGSIHGITTDEHHVQLLINGIMIADLIWMDQYEKTFSAKFPCTVINDGNNSLTIKHASTTSTSNKVLINWFEVEYKWGFEASSGYLSFGPGSASSDSLVQYTITGLSSYMNEVYKAGISKITNPTISLGASGLDYTLSFQDRVFGGEEYLVVQNDDKKRLLPGDIIPNDPSDLRTKSVNGSRYVVIGPDNLAQSAEKMVLLRRAKYPDALYVSTSDIYDEFNWGIPSDAAIRDFIRYAFANWTVQPDYVLLLGDGSYDPRNVLGNSKQDQVPVHLTRTDYYGGVADDDYYARVNGDDYLPDLSIGRLPINSNEEFEIWDSKRQLYEQRLFLDRWHKDILFVAGWPLNPEDNFYKPSDILASRISPTCDVSKVYHGYSFQNKEDLINRFNQGAAVAMFFGHGGAQLWSHGSFFWYYDVLRLNNWGRWPLIGSFTCSSGAFESPNYQSLSESFIFNYGGGIGVFSSSGASYGDSITGCILEKTFIEAFDQKGLRNFGDIAIAAKYGLSGQFPLSGQNLDMLVSYNLLCDPATRLALPDTGLKVDISNTAVTAGDSTLITITGPFSAGIATITLFDANQRISLQKVFPSLTGQAQTYLSIPDSVPAGRAMVKIYVKDDHSDWVAFDYLGIDSPAISGFKVMPPSPTDIDSIQISSIIQSLSGVDSAWCQWRWGKYDDTLGTMIKSPMSAQGDTYQLSDSIYLSGLSGNYHQGDDYYLIFQINLRDTTGTTTTSQWQRVRVLMRADLVPASTAQGGASLGGGRVMRLSTKIKNQGGIDIHSVPVFFYRAADDSILGFCLSDTILAGKEATISIPWTIEGEFTQVYFRIDPGHTAIAPYPQEDTTNDRSIVYWVPSQDYYYYQLDQIGTNQDTLDFYGKIRSVLPDSCLNDSAVAIIGRRYIDMASINQEGLTPIDSSGQTYFVSLIDSSRSLVSPKDIWVSLKLDSYDSTANNDNLKLFRLNDRSGMWQIVPSHLEGSSLTGNSPSLGTFAAFYSTDTSGPYITAKVDKQALGWGQVISVPSPQYSVLMEDKDGIDMDSIWVKVDGITISRNEYSLPQKTDNSLNVPLVYAPKLNNGMHSLEFGATDNLGNRSTMKVFNEVKVEFALKEIANYPNPVNGEYTTFYFFVGDIADRYTLEIYTVAGRLVKTFRGGRTSGVRTFEWDLRNENGNTISNGVYFYSFKVYQGTKMQEKTGKMAVLR